MRIAAAVTALAVAAPCHALEKWELVKEPAQVVQHASEAETNAALLRGVAAQVVITSKAPPTTAGTVLAGKPIAVLKPAPSAIAPTGGYIQPAVSDGPVIAAYPSGLAIFNVGPAAMAPTLEGIRAQAAKLEDMPVYLPAFAPYSREELERAAATAHYDQQGRPVSIKLPMTDAWGRQLEVGVFYLGGQDFPFALNVDGIQYDIPGMHPYSKADVDLKLSQSPDPGIAKIIQPKALTIYCKNAVSTGKAIDPKSVCAGGGGFLEAFGDAIFWDHEPGWGGGLDSEPASDFIGVPVDWEILLGIGRADAAERRPATAQRTTTERQPRYVVSAAEFMRGDTLVIDVMARVWDYIHVPAPRVDLHGQPNVGRLGIINGPSWPAGSVPPLTQMTASQALLAQQQYLNYQAEQSQRAQAVMACRMGCLWTSLIVYAGCSGATLAMAATGIGAPVAPAFNFACWASGYASAAACYRRAEACGG